MRSWVLVLVILTAASASLNVASAAKELAANRTEVAESTLHLRFSNQRVATCREPLENIAQRRLNCRAGSRGQKGVATLLFQPLPDPRRRVLRTDRRSPFAVELHHMEQPVEQSVSIARGPWRITWKEAKKSIRTEVEEASSSVMLTKTQGKCRSGHWRCWLDERALEHKLEILRTPGGQ